MLRAQSLSPLAAAALGICVVLGAATYTAHASQSAALGGWPPPLDLSQSGGSDSKDPDLALLQNGDLHVIWMEPRGVTSTLFSTLHHAKSRDRGANWTYSQPLTPKGQDRFQPAMDADEYGVLHVVWVEGKTLGQLRYTSLPGGNWGEPEEITSTTSAMVSPDVVVATDTVHAVWSQMVPGPSGSQTDVFHSWSEAGGAWSPATATVETRFSSWSPRVAEDPSGNLHLVWEEDATPEEILYISGTVYASGTVWSMTTTVSAELSQAAITPDVAVGSDYRVHVVFGAYVDGQTDVQEIYHAAFQANDPGAVSPTLIPGSRVTVSHQLPKFASPAVALFGDDQVHVAWNGWKEADYQDANRIYYAVSEDGGVSWSWPVPASPRDTEPDGFACLAADAQYVHLVWQEKASSTDEDIYYARRFPVRMPLPLGLKEF